MSFRRNRAALQVVIAVAGLVPVGAGAAGVLIGPALAGGRGAGASLDSHFRYLSGLLLAIGLLFWSAVPRIERQGPLVRTLTVIVAVGGLGRAVSLLHAGAPDAAMRWALAMELLVTPLICLWQFDVERRYRLV